MNLNLIVSFHEHEYEETCLGDLGWEDLDEDEQSCLHDSDDYDYEEKVETTEKDLEKAIQTLRKEEKSYSYEQEGGSREEYVEIRQVEVYEDNRRLSLDEISKFVSSETLEWLKKLEEKRK